MKNISRVNDTGRSPFLLRCNFGLHDAPAGDSLRFGKFGIALANYALNWISVMETGAGERSDTKSTGQTAGCRFLCRERA